MKYLHRSTAGYDAESGAHISGMGTVPDGAKVMMLKPVRTNNLTWNMTL